MPYLKIGKNDIYYHFEIGDPDKVMLLLHSLGTNHSLWKYQIDYFSKKGYTVIAPDARGHGKSSCYYNVSVDQWVSDLVSILDHLKIEKAFVCGVSMGGVEAMALAIKHPERIQGLVLADTFAKIVPEAVPEKIRLTAGVARLQGMEEYADTYLDNTLSDSPSALEIRNSLRQAIAGMDVEDYVSSAVTCFSADLEEQLPIISVPTLVIIGEDDFKTPIDLSDAIASKIPNAKLQIIPKGRHLSNVDEPVFFNKLVYEYSLTIDRTF
jgi:3-oxoadipate enol-lactonase